MKDSSKKDLEMDLEPAYGKTVLFMKVVGRQINVMVKESYFSQTALIMKANFFITKEMGKECRNG